MKEVVEGFGLTLEQTEILYNIEFQKAMHDIETGGALPERRAIHSLKSTWLNEWKHYMTEGFSSFLQKEDVQLTWYTKTGLLQRISELDPAQPWFRLVLLEAMLFKPYFPLTTEEGKNGKAVPSRKYIRLQNPVNGFNVQEGDRYLDAVFSGEYCAQGYIKRLRKGYDKSIRELNEVTKTVIKSLSVTAAVALLVMGSAGTLAPTIATILVGSAFPGLSGAALTSVCLAYLGGGAIAVDGIGMASSTIAIVGGGAVLGFGLGSKLGSSAAAADLAGKQNTIIQSAKLLVSVREIFLNDEQDLEYAKTIYEKYTQNILVIEQDIDELQLQADVSQGVKKRELLARIKQTDKTVEAMKIARKSMLKFQTAFQEGTLA